ncbi:hypothetical protein N7450_007380 [Penicillium hetheringtonii]|uniref:Fungal-specific transcription factor domain-containing protein n=1 Tax=Penicillium hetheringtonii TaxID=911720 RepID=A0AAD6GQI6_9EURO|nr:hypothetical protein N7450_007380 [Penicillium hetheringtonii]
METSPTVTNSAGLFTTRTVIQEDPHALYDCLKHKQYALKQIQKDILNAGHQNIEGTIASMLLLVWQDLMDSGKDSWKYHLNALRKTAQLQKFSKSSSGRSVSFGFRGLEDYLEMTYAALHILGTTFIQSKDPYQPLFSTLPTQDMTKLSDGEVWAGCPGEILHIISSINDISRTQSSPAGPATQIMLELTAFSPIKWAVGSSQPNLMKSRYHLATVYKHSAMIYLHQVFHQLPRLSDAKMTDPGSLDSAVLHIQSISPKDPHFKSLVWPAFVIGAEIKIEAHKLVITQTFEQLCDIWRCQNVSNALNVLQNLWKRDNEIPDFIPWIGEIHRSGMDWIFV